MSSLFPKMALDEGECYVNRDMILEVDLDREDGKLVAITVYKREIYMQDNGTEYELGDGVCAIRFSDDSLSNGTLQAGKDFLKQLGA